MKARLVLGGLATAVLAYLVVSWTRSPGTVEAREPTRPRAVPAGPHVGVSFAEAPAVAAELRTESPIVEERPPAAFVLPEPPAVTPLPSLPLPPPPTDPGVRLVADLVTASVAPPTVEPTPAGQPPASGNFSPPPMPVPPHPEPALTPATAVAPSVTPPTPTRLAPVPAMQALEFTTFFTPVFEGGAIGHPIPYTVKVTVRVPEDDQVFEQLRAQLPDKVKGMLQRRFADLADARRPATPAEAKVDVIAERLRRLEKRLNEMEKAAKKVHAGVKPADEAQEKPF